MNKKIISMGFSEFLEDNVKEITTHMKWMQDRTMKLIKSLDELKEFVDKAIEAKICCVDIETTGLNTRTRNGAPIDKIVGICLSYDIKIGVYVPLNHVVEPELNLPEKEVLDEIKRLCTNCVTVYHNSKFDLQFLKNYGIIVNEHNKFEDTLILARLYDAGQKVIGLKELSESMLNQPMIEFTDIAKDAKRFDFVPPSVGYLYASSDAICTLQLFHFYMGQDIIKEQMSVYRLEKRVVPVVMEMEANLVKVDVPYLIKLRSDIEKRIKDIELNIHKLAGKEFNVASSQQLGKLLFDELRYEYPMKDRTKSGQYSTDNEVLEKIADQYPIVQSIIEFRELEKSKGTYIENLINNRDENDFLKFAFSQTGTDTGRFSSPGGRGINEDGYGKVNAQNLPSNYDPGVPDVRRALIARPGMKLVSIDYSGEELRVAANLSHESKWIDEFINGKGDLHTKTAQVLFGKQEVTKLERLIGKTFNFQILYGAGARGLAAQAKISENEAKRLLANFFAGLPQLKRWIDTEVKRSKKTKVVKTAFGRMRPLAKFFDSNDFAQIAHGERCVANTLVQGICADIMKTAMVRIHGWIHNNNLQDDLKILLTIHDELIFEMPEEKMPIYVPKIIDIMRLTDILQGLLKWPVPLAMDCEYGDSLHVDHNYLKEHPEASEVKDHVNFHTSTQVTVSEPVSETPASILVTTPIVDSIPVIEVSIPVPVIEVVPTIVTPDSTGFIDINSLLANPELQKISSVDIPQDIGEVLGNFMKESFQEQPIVTQEIPVSPAFENLSPDSELKPAEKNDLTNKDTLIYTIRDRSKSSQRRLNHLLLFLLDEEKDDKYQGPKKNIIIKDKDGNSLLVSEFKFSVDAFLALARFYGV
jgi:DNA polymerase I-like protein with 3'-5' exonuclease and polymerase domains